MKILIRNVIVVLLGTLALSTTVLAQSRVTGRVLAANNEGLVGVSITIKGTTQGVITGNEGDFAINAKPDQQLVFSYIGYQTQTLPIGNRTQFNITMAEDTDLLNEVVVVGYGTTRKTDLTSAVAQVDAKKLQDLPTSRVDQALQGRASGVQVTSVNGSPGARASIRIRGGNSVNADNEPLFVIDGFIVGTDFNLNNLNTNDIESIDILKDATAISIYGTRGANGVVLITTKSGKSVPKGKPRVSANFYTGFQRMARKIDYLDGSARVAYGKELAAFSGEADPFSNPDESANTDWQDLVSRTAPIYNGDVSVAGQTEGLSYYVSANVSNATKLSF